MNIEERLQWLESECFNNKQRRQLDAHFTGQLFNGLVQSGIVDGIQLKKLIVQIGEGVKKGANYDPDVSQIVDEHTASWAGHITEIKQKEFILSGGMN